MRAAVERARRGWWIRPRPAGRSDQPRGHRRSGRRADRHGRLLRREVRLRSRRSLPGQAAHGRGRQCGARRARRSVADGARAMNEAVKNQELRDKIAQDYEWGFSSDIEQEFAPKGLSEDTVRFISAKKNEPEWMLEWRLKGYRAWLEMEEVSWAKLDIPEIDYRAAYCYAAPKPKEKLGSLDEGGPEILRV